MSERTLLPDAQSNVLMFPSLLALGQWNRLPDSEIKLMACPASVGAGAGCWSKANQLLLFPSQICWCSPQAALNWYSVTQAVKGEVKQRGWWHRGALGSGGRTRVCFLRGWGAGLHGAGESLQGGKRLWPPIIHTDLQRESCTPTEVQHQENSSISLLQITF